MFTVTLKRGTKVEVITLAAAGAAVRKFLDDNGLGSSEYTGGRVVDANGKHVATVSYNGRVWHARGGAEVTGADLGKFA